MCIAARQNEDIARFQFERRLTFARYDARAIEHDVIDRFARRRARMIEFERTAQKTTEIERAGKARKLNQAIESVHERRGKTVSLDTTEKRVIR